MCALRMERDERTFQDVVKHQIWHQAPLRVMHEEPIPPPTLRFLTTVTTNIALGNKSLFSATEVVHEVLDDIARFEEDQRLGLSWTLNGDGW